MGATLGGVPPAQGGGKERQGSDLLGIGTLARKSAELGAQIGEEASRAKAFKEASHEVLVGGDEIVRLVSSPEEAKNVSMALAELAVRILLKK
jgi:hypothetical protein